jgi:XapX domain-containing protein
VDIEHDWGRGSPLPCELERGGLGEALSSLACGGVLVGAIYGLLGVKSPAPPTIALIGLLGMLLGEQAVPVARKLIHRQPVVAFIKADCVSRILGTTTDDNKPRDA